MQSPDNPNSWYSKNLEFLKTSDNNTNINDLAVTYLFVVVSVGGLLAASKHEFAFIPAFYSRFLYYSFFFITFQVIGGFGSWIDGFGSRFGGSSSSD